MAHDAARACVCVAEHRPPYLELEAHHVWPLYLGGPRDGEMRWLCGTTHQSVHELLRLMERAGRSLTYRECQDAEDRPVARYAHDLAARGWDAYAASPLMVTDLTGLPWTGQA